ncbi:carbon-nitrogen hydrolase family protein [Agromyces seonyuensis]|uniref:Hydrolase n=1 Tax=Agromyces seonyuensis TaxID=2662446 RepID=A0A6I4P1A7_9MICO|nr:carbon-nitrogen hydrolase family protein [Agromyces seonyuensis]MWC00152.1 hydrolase [Agromyces seonyuensis]
MTASDATGELLVAVAQFAPGPDRAANLAAIGDLVRTAVLRGARLVVLPEYSAAFTPTPGPEWVANAEPLDGPFVAGLGNLADELGVVLVAGLLEPAPGAAVDGHDRVHNTLVAVAPRAGVVATYRKQHLYDAFGSRESEWVAPGALGEPELFEIEGVRFGLQTCYDVRFPEVSRMLVDAGADAICMPAEWVPGPLKAFHWRSLVTARAIENTVYVLAADHTAPGGVGESLVVDPMGVALASLGERADAAVAALSLDRIAAVRRTNPALELRRYRVEPAE